MKIVLGTLENPRVNIQELFNHYDKKFFHGKLQGVVQVAWSEIMTVDAGICWEHIYVGRTRGRGYRYVREVSIWLSWNLLKFRHPDDTKWILLHEMIHAYLFVTNSDEKEDHGPQFIQWMNFINRVEKTKISIRHNFWKEMEHYKQKERLRRMLRKRKRKSTSSTNDDDDDEVEIIDPRETKRRKIGNDNDDVILVDMKKPMKKKKKKKKKKRKPTVIILLDSDSEEEEE